MVTPRTSIRDLRRSLPVFSVLLLCVFMGSFGAVLTTTVLTTTVLAESHTDAAELHVQVQATSLRLQPKHWARPLDTLVYGERVVELSEDQGWHKVRTSRGKTGYLHRSALTSKEVLLSSSSRPTDTTADRSEVVIAGKGFNDQVEREYAKKNRSANFRAVDRMERRRVRSNELALFVSDGDFVPKAKDGRS